MSIRVMAKVWDQAKYAEGTLLALLALADWADDSGRCFPSIAELAAKSRLTERQVYTVLKVLRTDGVLERTGEVAMRDGRGWRFLKGDCGGRGRFIVYRINTEMFSGIPAANPEKISGIPAEENEGIPRTETLKSATKNPEVCDIPPHPPLGRTVSKPSKNPTPTPPRKREGGSASKPSGERETPPERDRGVRGLDWATEMLARECDVAGPRRQRLLRLAIAQYAAKERMSPWEAATAMAAAWREYRAAEFQRWRWGPVKFFAGGHWRMPELWPWDQPAMRMAREARMGASR